MIIDIAPMQQWWHLEHAIKLACDIFAQHTHYTVNAQNLRAELTHQDAHYYVALENGGVKGFAGWKRTGVNKHVYEFPWCVVHPGWQRQGIGSVLTEKRIHDIKQRDGAAIILTTSVPAVYRRHGFFSVALLPDTWANHFMMLMLREGTIL